ncbi:uncharacterized protein C8A04DRAFT_37471 [Dichotomopilus funicola]|uniref:DUF1917-domain-containing protein n=1 Tax=Dichotomopilus funicola TaxID=1934379 RepID=A0AAN6V283_9PEZI|nr:hypothetical protein C8A04DRAFT_37471 [Dichotomopilus funicola]
MDKCHYSTDIQTTANISFTREPNEPLYHFLQRLPPRDLASATPSHLLPPWLWITNPHLTPQDRKSPPDLDAFLRDGGELLAGFREAAAKVETSTPQDRGNMATTKLMEELRERLRKRIMEVAKDSGVTSGKWMLFPHEKEVNEVWRTVCEGVEAGQLGTGAKVATAGIGQNPTRLICVYTVDFTDVADVGRVLFGLVNLGLVPADMSREITYKCDAYTYLGIYHGNEYGLRKSIWGGSEIMPMMRQEMDLD